jgi:hypothetical protein
MTTVPRLRPARDVSASDDNDAAPAACETSDPAGKKRAEAGPRWNSKAMRTVQRLRPVGIEHHKKSGPKPAFLNLQQ